MVVGITDGDEHRSWDIEYQSEEPYDDKLEAIRCYLSGNAQVLGFNFKFDAGWFMRYGIRPNIDLWDCQLAEYIISDQENRFPSLDEVAAKYGIPGKLDIVKRDYWEQGIDTRLVPPEVLLPYLKQDCDLLPLIYLHQIDECQHRPKLERLIRLASNDSMITCEMEFNGLKYNIAKSYDHQIKLEIQLQDLDQRLNDFTNGVEINWNSGQHISALLFGGILKKKVRESYTKTLKSGQVKIKEHWVDKLIPLPRLVTPDPRSKLATEGYYSTDALTLRTLKCGKKARKLIDTLLERARVEKQLSTYFVGIPKLMREREWENDTIHGNLNHTATRTGRLSSSAPNQQNLDAEVKSCIVSRYDN